MKKPIKSTAAIVDIRGFTRLFEEFRDQKKDDLLLFMEKYYFIGIHFASLVAFDKKVYINTTGDGFLVVFYGKNHEFSGYLYGLLLYNVLNKLCEDFSKETNHPMSYGIGIESGVVHKVYSGGKGNKEINTLLGSVINRATRIESATKMFHRTKLIIGNTLYENLIKKLYKKEYEEINYKKKLSKKEYTEILDFHHAMNKLNQDMMLFYISEHVMPGVDEAMPLFRLSPTLVSAEGNKYWQIIKKLCVTPEKLATIKKEYEKFMNTK